MMSDNHVYIIAAARTPIGSFNGTLAKTKASELGSIVIKELLKRADVQPQDINEVILGQSLTAGQGQNPARQAALGAGLPLSAIAYGINLLCGSGLKSVTLGAQSIRNGDASIVIAGGQESMSLAPHVLHLRQGTKLGPSTMQDSMLFDGLTDAFHNIHMGVTAENMATKYNISREQQDAAALQSQTRAAAAQKQGYFKAEIVPVEIKSSKGNTSFEEDEYIKHDASLAGLQKLKPVFKSDGSVTPGNASGINDAAAAVLLMSEAEVKQRGAKPLARIVAWSQTGCAPELMGMGPIAAVEFVLKKAGWTKEQVDLFELNEAFAAQALGVNQELGLDDSKVNIHGGAIALGHPIGASGCRVLVTLIYALKRTGGKRGIASLCIGGGMGIAMAIELVN